MKKIPIIITKEMSNDDLMKYITSLRSWCRKNVKKKWLTTSLKTSSDPDRKYIFVFHFESDKDAMMFNLYRRY